MPRREKLNSVDVHIGDRLRTQRALSGLSQTELANRLSITFQQLQKYETGNNRISVGRLWQVSTILAVPVSRFFDGLKGNTDSAADTLNTRLCLEIVRYYHACPKDIREQMYQSGKALADILRPTSDKETD